MTRAVLVLMLALAACMRPPRNLAGDFPPLTVREALSEPRPGTAVRWGGTVVQTTPGRERTCFEIVALPLDREARPEPSDDSPGRFIACAAGFYDPTVYAPGREATIVGTLHGETAGKVGGYDYRYPMVDATAVHLWEQRPRRRTGLAPRVGISIGGVFGGRF